MVVEMTQKFKVGDLVKGNDASCDLVSHWNHLWATKGEMGLARTDGCFYVTKVTERAVTYSNKLGGDGPSTSPEFLDLAYPPKSPVIERTVKEVVPGVYGIVNVNNTAGKPSLVSKDRSYTAQELRAAADVFLVLAGYLEEKE